MAADTEPIEILLHLPLLAEDKVSNRSRWRRPLAEGPVRRMQLVHHSSAGS